MLAQEALNNKELSVTVHYFKVKDLVSTSFDGSMAPIYITDTNLKAVAVVCITNLANSSTRFILHSPSAMTLLSPLQTINL